MKKVGLLLMVLAIAVALNASVADRAEALPAINTQFKKTFAKNEKLMAAAKEVKYCNVCHFGKSKKNRNDYGMELSKYFTKADYQELKKDKAALAKAIESAFEKAAKGKAKDGSTFGEKMKAGELPGTDPEG